VQDFRARYPSFEQRSANLPPLAGTLAAACECLVPQSIDALPEGAQLSDITGHCVVLVVAVDDLPKPCTDVAWAIMHPATELGLDSLELRNHPHLRRNAPDGERVGLVPSPTVVRESSPGELHSEALAEPSVKLSPHSAPIRQTHQSYQDSSARKDPLVPLRAVEEIGSPGPCDP
jgi:hypothetical protein